MLRAPREIPAENPVGHEWIYAAELLDYPVDIALHVRVEDSRSALRHLSRKKGMAEAQLEEYESAGEEAPLELMEELDTTAELERNLRLAGSLVHVKMIVGLGAPDEDTLRQRAKRLVTDLGDIQLVQAPGDQQRFCQAFYPWGRGVQTAYEIPMDAGLFAAALPFATQGFGDPSGMLLGETNSGDPCSSIRDVRRRSSIVRRVFSSAGRSVRQNRDDGVYHRHAAWRKARASLSRIRRATIMTVWQSFRTCDIGSPHDAG